VSVPDAQLAPEHRRGQPIGSSGRDPTADAPAAAWTRSRTGRCAAQVVTDVLCRATAIRACSSVSGAHETLSRNVHPVDPTRLSLRIGAARQLARTSRAVLRAVCRANYQDQFFYLIAPIAPAPGNLSLVPKLPGHIPPSHWRFFIARLPTAPPSTRTACAANARFLLI